LAGKQIQLPLKTNISRNRDGLMHIPWAACGEEREKFRLLLEGFPLAAAVVSPSGRYEYLNPKFMDTFGYSLTDIPSGRAWFRRAYPDKDYRAQVISAWLEDSNKFGSEEPRSRSFKVRCKNGEEKDVLFRFMIFADGRQLVLCEDVTEKSQAESDLRTSEEKYRSILESMDEGCFEVDLAGNLTFFNAAVSRILGYPADELLGMNNRHYMNEENARKVFDVFNEVHKTGEPRRAFDWEIVTREGTKRFVEASVFLIRDGKNRPRGFRGIVRDVTERRKAEDALREGEERYRQLVNHAPAGIYEVDFIQRKFLTVNDVMCEYTGYTKEEFLSMSPFDLLTEDGKILFMERMSKILSGEKIPEMAEFQINGKGGRKFWVILNAKVVYENGFPKGATVVVHDVTERKNADEALRRSEEKHRLLVNNANDGIFIAKDGRIIFPNPKTLEMLGYSSDQIGEVFYPDLVHPDDKRILEEAGKRMARGETTSETFSLRVMNSERKELWVAVSSVPIIWESGPATLNFVRDISLQKRAENELNETINKLRKITGATIQAMAQTIEVRDPYTAGHQRRVADLARAIAAAMGLNNDQVDGIRMAGAIHDIGKISVPAEILSKPGILSPIEFSLIKTHSQVGYEILKDIDFPWDIAGMVLQHHERMDGSGYPNGLAGDRIMLEARIIAVADVVEAMASHRPYRPAVGMDKALEEISTKRGLIYDSKVVDTCLKVLKERIFSFK